MKRIRLADFLLSSAALDPTAFYDLRLYAHPDVLADIIRQLAARGARTISVAAAGGRDILNAAVKADPTVQIVALLGVVHDEPLITTRLAIGLLTNVAGFLAPASLVVELNRQVPPPKFVWPADGDIFQKKRGPKPQNRREAATSSRAARLTKAGTSPREDED